MCQCLSVVLSKECPHTVNIAITDQHRLGSAITLDSSQDLGNALGRLDRALLHPVVVREWRKEPVADLHCSRTRSLLSAVVPLKGKSYLVEVDLYSPVNLASLDR